MKLDDVKAPTNNAPPAAAGNGASGETPKAPAAPKAKKATPAKEKTMKKATKKTVKKSKPEKKGGGDRRKNISPDDVIHLIAKYKDPKNNPKKGKAADRFAKLKDGMKVKDFLRASGAKRRHVAGYRRRGYVTIVPAAA